MACRRDFNILCLLCKCVVFKRCRVCSDTGFVACRRFCNGIGSVDRFSLFMSTVIVAYPCRRYAAVVFRPYVCRLSPVVTSSGYDHFLGGCIYHAFELDFGSVNNLSVFFARRGGLIASGRCRYCFGVRRVISTNERRRRTAVIVAPAPRGFAIAVTGRGKVYGLGLRCEVFAVKRYRVCCRTI